MIMRVLVLESDPHTAHGAIVELQAAGHKVLRCHEPDMPAFPCNALFDGGSCPLDQEPVDVVLDHRAHVSSRPTPYEDGISCALRRHIPLVTSGMSVFSPFEPWTVTHVGDDGVVAACEAAIAAPIEPLARPAREALQHTLANAGSPTDGADVEVHRQGGRLHATVSIPVDAGEVEGAVAVKIAGVLRAADRHATKVDVTVRRTEP
jgi:hypothetical protein